MGLLWYFVGCMVVGGIAVLISSRDHRQVDPWGCHKTTLGCPSTYFIATIGLVIWTLIYRGL